MEGSRSEPSSYGRRVIDTELDELLSGLPALSLEGARGVGKTSTARQRGGTVLRLDDPASLEVIQAQPELLTTGTLPIVIDEWQRYPPAWDVVRRAVDDHPGPGRFILTGSATPTTRPTHSGAGRIVTRRMRPLTLPERSVETPTVSLADLLSNGGTTIGGSTEITLEDYTSEILAGGFPGMRHPNPRTQRAALDGYLLTIIDADLPGLGVEVRSPATLQRWATAYAAATSTTTSYDKIRAAAGEGGAAPAKTTAIPYRDALERLWVLDPVPAWLPTNNHLRRLTAGPKHQLVDPALAARLVGIDAGALLRGEGPASLPRDGAFLGALFESLVALSLRVFAQGAEATVAHFRTQGGEREVDYIVARRDRRVLGVEVKLSQTVSDDDVRHLSWLRQRLDGAMVDAIVVTTGRFAYRRPDGIGVVPLALLGP